jgi:hypothetical protein
MEAANQIAHLLGRCELANAKSDCKQSLFDQILHVPQILSQVNPAGFDTRYPTAPFESVLTKPIPGNRDSGKPALLPSRVRA